jgi:hypothetical protein
MRSAERALTKRKIIEGDSSSAQSNVVMDLKCQQMLCPIPQANDPANTQSSLKYAAAPCVPKP